MAKNKINKTLIIIIIIIIIIIYSMLKDFAVQNTQSNVLF